MKNKSTLAKFSIYGIIVISVLFQLGATVGASAIVARATTPTANATIVPCGYPPGAPDCNMCHLLTMIINIFQYLIVITGFVVVLMLIISGFIYVIGPSISPSAIQLGKRSITYTIAGFIIIVAAWAVLNTIAGQSGLGYKDSKFGDIFNFSTEITNGNANNCVFDTIGEPSQLH